MGVEARGSGERGVVRLLLGVVSLVVFFIVALGVIVALTFSVSVNGHSMNPTLHTGDRLLWNVFSRHDIHRFEVVEAITPDVNQTHVVKRVIGMPGDQIAIPPVDGTPEVYVRTGGATYVVTNTTWDRQVGADVSACCKPDGTSSPKLRWATVPAGSYFVMGDNWGGSTDSRVYGFVGSAHIGGTLGFELWPPSRFGRVPNHASMAPLH